MGPRPAPSQTWFLQYAFRYWNVPKAATMLVSDMPSFQAAELMSVLTCRAAVHRDVAPERVTPLTKMAPKAGPFLFARPGGCRRTLDFPGDYSVSSEMVIGSCVENASKQPACARS